MERAKSRPKAPKKVGAKNGKGKEATAVRERLFVEAMIATGGNKTESAIRAGYSARTASQMGLKLAKRPSVQEALRARQDELAEKHELTTESVLSELAKIVHADPRKLFNADGTMKAPNEWPDSMAGVIASVEVREEFEGQGESRVWVGYTKKVKLFDKNSGIDKAMKHLGLFEKDNKQRSLLGDVPRDKLKAIVEHLTKHDGESARS